MMEVREEADLIIIYGPPHSGKSSWCKQHLSTFARVEPAVEFKKSPSLTIRQLVVSKIISLLKERRKVVIDDENGSYVKRDSYICLVKKRFPDCKILCISFDPIYGSRQLLWAREYAFVEAVAKQLITKICEPDVKWNLRTSDREMHKWMEETEKLEPPRISEGYWKIEMVRKGLIATSKYMLELPALFVEWSGLFDKTSGDVLPKVSETFSLWYEQNPLGRILIVCDSKALNSEIGAQEKIIRQVMMSLCEKLSSCPVYLISVTDQTESGEFSLPPAPGLLIFLQKLHCLDFTVRGTAYLYQSSAHMIMAERAGIKHVKASKIFTRPDLVQRMHSFTSVPVPTLLREIEIHGDTEDDSGPLVPLCQSTEGDPPFISAKLGCGRRLYMAAKSQAALKKYHMEYSKNASLSTEKESRITRLNRRLPSRTPSSETTSMSTKDASARELPQWMKRGRSKDTSVTEVSERSPKRLKGKKSDSILSSNAPVYVMSIEELREIATETIEQIGESRSMYSVPESNEKPSSLSELFTMPISPAARATSHKEKTTPEILENKEDSEHSDHSDLQDNLDELLKSDTLTH